MFRVSPQDHFGLLRKALVRGSCAAWGRTVSQNCVFFRRSQLSGAAVLPVAELFPEIWLCRCIQRQQSQQNALSEFLGVLSAEQDVGNLKSCTFRNSGTPVRRTERRKSQKHTLSGILGHLCAEQNVGNLKK